MNGRNKLFVLGPGARSVLLPPNTGIKLTNAVEEEMCRACRVQVQTE